MMKNIYKLISIVMCSFVVMGCSNNKVDNNFDFTGNWSSDGYEDSASIEYTQEGEFLTSSKISNDQTIESINSYVPFIGDEAYEKLISLDNENRIQEDLLKSIIDSDDKFNVTNLFAIEYSNKDVLVNGESVLGNDEWEVVENGLMFGFILDDGNTYYLANQERKITDIDYWIIHHKKQVK